VDFGEGDVWHGRLLNQNLGQILEKRLGQFQQITCLVIVKNGLGQIKENGL
jgi:hypothetical protein